MTTKMGFGYRCYFIDKEDKLVRIPQQTFYGLITRDGSLPEYKNRKMKFMLVDFTTKNKKPIKIDHITKGYITINKHGKLSESSKWVALIINKRMPDWEMTEEIEQSLYKKMKIPASRRV